MRNVNISFVAALEIKKIHSFVSTFVYSSFIRAFIHTVPSFFKKVHVNKSTPEDVIYNIRDYSHKSKPTGAGLVLTNSDSVVDSLRLLR